MSDFMLKNAFYNAQLIFTFSKELIYIANYVKNYLPRNKSHCELKKGLSEIGTRYSVK